MRITTLVLLILSGLLPLLHNQPVAAELSLRDKQTSVAQTLAAFEQNYVFADKAKLTAKHILSQFTPDHLAQYESYEALADGLGKALRESTGDNHLGVAVRKEGPISHIIEPLEDKRKYNHAFEQVRILSGNIGYLKLNKFSPDNEAFEVADFTMGFIRDSRALIIDLRDNIGGSPALATYLASHFFATDEPLWKVVSRHNEVTGEWLADATPFKLDVPVVILTSNTTASAAELFTFLLKHGKGVRTVGENTYGIAYLVGAAQINERLFGRFSMSRIEIEATEGDWEQKGIAPDVNVAAEDALTAALDLLQDAG